MLSIVGLEELFFVNDAWSRDGVIDKQISCKHNIYAIDDEGKKFKIKLRDFEGECLSGACVSFWAKISVKSIATIPACTHVAIKKMRIEHAQLDKDDFENSVMSFSAMGSDPYYPSGGYTVKMSCFKPTARYRGKRIVWLIRCRAHPELGKLQTVGLSTNGTIYDDIVVIGQQSPTDIVPRLFSEPCVVVIDIENPGMKRKVFRGESGTGKSFIARKLGMTVCETDTGSIDYDADIIVVGNLSRPDVDSKECREMWTFSYFKPA